MADRHGCVQTITLNRPAKLNALSDALLAELTDALKTAERDESIRAVVITGAGRAFCAGADLAAFAGEPRADGKASVPRLGAFLRAKSTPLVLRLFNLEKPIVAAVNGVAAGAGMSLALGCDIRIAAESARFILSFVNVGLVPDLGSTYFLPRLVGAAKAVELAMTGDPVPAPEALALGMVNRVVADSVVLAESQALAERLARAPRASLALIKRGMGRGHERSLDRALELEADYQEIASRTDDFVEGLDAFLHKRSPSFE
ncbi:MAG: enoyl-CoA hydratase/isomerase family protein [Chloroflexi bacterium]|nr:enoyl-CoA hydratase/isomerase family protein [Chloroflexota bacterium]